MYTEILLALLIFAIPSVALADITSTISSSIKLEVAAPGTTADRIGNSYSVSGTGVTTTDGTTARAADAALGSLNIDASHLTDIQGIVPIPAGYAVGDDDMVASVSSIGMIAKAEAGSTSLYAFGISTTGDTISTTFNLKFGIVKD